MLPLSPRPRHSVLFPSLTLVGSLPSLSLPAPVRAVWPFSAALAEHDYARLQPAGGGSSHISIEMGDRRVSDVSDDTL